MRRALIVLGFAAATLAYTYPLSLHPSTRALDLGPDTRLFLWTLAWDVEALTTRPLALFDANIFYPEPRTLAYSEHQLGSALLAAPFLLVTNDLLFSMNLVMILSCFGAFLGAYYLARTLGLGTAAAIVAAIVFALSPPRLFRIGQLHLATVYWIPVTLALLHRYANGGSRRHLLLAVVAFSFQTLFGAQSGLFLAVAVAALGAHLALAKRLKPRSSLIVDGAWATALVVALNLPFALPYFRVQRELGLERSLAEASRWSPNPESFLASPAHVDRALLRAAGLERAVLRDARAFLFPGLVPLALALYGMVCRDRSRDEGPRALVALIVLDGAILLFVALALAVQMAGGVRFDLFGTTVSASSGSRALLVALGLTVFRFVRYRSRPAFTLLELDFYALLALGSLWLSLGPDGGLYAWLYRFVPGFDFIRVPPRFTILTVVALSVLAGVGYQRVEASRRLGRFAPALIVALLVELAAFPLDAEPYAIPTSPMDRWIASHGGAEAGAVVNLPVPDPSDDVASARRHSVYMLHSIAHFRPVVNGYSGFTPQRHERWFRSLSRFPGDGDGDGAETFVELANTGVRFVSFHRGGYRDDEWAGLLKALDRMSDRLALKASFDDGRVYELVP